MARDPMVSTGWLAERLSDPVIRVLDGTWRMPGDPADPKADFQNKHIPQARFFAIDEIADRSSPLPHMAPPPGQFAIQIGELGIGNSDIVIVYDQLGLFSAARVWWTFRLMGHEDVFVLDGGLPKWVAEGRPVESGAPLPADPMVYRPSLRQELVSRLEEVRASLDSGDRQVVDARPAARFRGAKPEPREGLRSGHMPRARSLPYGELLRADGTLTRAAEIESAFAAAGVDTDRAVTASCGSGLTAAILALALARCGRWDATIYDGSWIEWGGRSDTPVVIGDAGTA